MHQILQIAMGWDDYHLHEFRHGKKRYGPFDDEFDSQILNAYEYTPGQPSHEETLEWLGDDFDPGAFDKEAINYQLQHFAKQQQFSERLLGMMAAVQGVMDDEVLSREDHQCIDRYFPQGGMVGDGLPDYG